MTNPNPIPQRNCIELLRVSSNKQDVARQRRDLEQVKKRFNLNAIRTLELHGVSGTAVLDNDQVQQVLRDLEDPSIEGMACSSLDRIFRPKDYTQVGILDKFAKRQKLIWSEREGELDPHSDSGFEQCMNLATRAGAEWRELHRRTKGGRRETLELKKKLDCGKARYGYIYLDKYHPDPELRQTYQLDPKEALPGYPSSSSSTTCTCGPKPAPRSTASQSG